MPPAPLDERRSASSSHGPVARPLQVAVALVPWTWFSVRDAATVLEWVAILLPLLVAVAVAAALVAARALHRTWLLAVASSWGLLGVVAVAAPWLPQTAVPARDPLRIEVANVRGDNPNAGGAATAVAGRGADLVVVDELTPLTAAVATALDARYPHRWLASPEDGVGVWSRHPLAGAALPTNPALAGARGGRVIVAAPGGPVVLYALHLYRPSRHPFGNEVTVRQQAELVAALARAVDGEDLPAVVAGDLNLTDRGSGYRTLLAGRRDAVRAGWAAPTSLRPRNLPLLLRIDHLLVPSTWCAREPERFAIPGSDHRGVLVSAGACV